MRKYSNDGRGLYRSRDGVLLGVCRGVADYFDLSVFWVRMAVVLIFLLSGFWPVLGVYLAAALLMKPSPVRPIESEDEQEFYDSYVHSPRSAAQRLKRQFDNIDRRIRRMESTVTGKDYDWERRFNS
jgi:phage shock protein C